MNPTHETDETQLLERCGYRVVRIGHHIRFEQRKTHLPMIMVPIFGSITFSTGSTALMLGIVFASQQVAAEVQRAVLISLFVLTAFFAAVTLLFFLTWRRRKATTGPEAAVLILDRSTGTILAPDGTQIGHAAQTTIRRVRVTGGSGGRAMRLVEVDTARGAIRIFASGRSAELEQIESLWAPPSPH